MKSQQKIKQYIFTGFGFLTLLLMLNATAWAQTNEPEVAPMSEPRTYKTEGITHGLGVHLFLNNFGFGLGGQYRLVVSPMSEMTFNAGITGLRDVSEQTFYDFFGQQIIPNKYSRVINFPFMISYKHRIFARSIADNFRLYLSGGVGPTLAFIYPYFKDYNDNGYRDTDTRIAQFEPINDFFQGWGKGHSQWGLDGNFKIGVDFGDNFANLSSIEFGYTFYYFGGKGIQMMEPNQPDINDQGQYQFNPDGSLKMKPFKGPDHYFGTPQISFIFGKMW